MTREQFEECYRAIEEYGRTAGPLKKCMAEDFRNPDPAKIEERREAMRRAQEARAQLMSALRLEE